MVDVHDREARRRNMAAILAKDTKPELLIRSALHARGFRYRLHVRGLPGKPDMVLSRYRAVVFIHGCFWHGHGCSLFSWPQTREEFWRAKIGGNRSRDMAASERLLDTGWRVATVWECALKGPKRLAFTDLIDSLVVWLFSDQSEISLQETNIDEAGCRSS